MISYSVYLSDALEADVTDHSIDNSSIDMENIDVVDEWSAGRCHGDEPDEDGNEDEDGDHADIIDLCDDVIVLYNDDDDDMVDMQAQLLTT